MKRLGLALALLAAFANAALAQVGGLSFPGPGPGHSAAGTTPAFNWIANAANAIGSNTTSTTVGTTNVGTGCGTLTAGDTLIVGLYLFSTTTNTVTPPSGFTQIGTNQNDGQGMQSIWQHQLGAGESCASYTFSWTTTSFSTWAIIDATGVASVSPVDTSSVSTSSDAGTGNFTTSAITTTHSPDYLVLMMFAGNIASTTFTKPSDMTLRLSQLAVGSNMAMLVSDAQKATTVSGFTETATNTTTSKIVTYGLIALHN